MAAEEHLPSPGEWRETLGLQRDEVIPMGQRRKTGFPENHRAPEGPPGWQVHRGHGHYPDPFGRGQEHHGPGADRRAGKTRRERGRLPAPAFRRSHHEHQGHRRRRRQGAADPHDRILHGPDRRHQRRHECPQPGHGRVDRPHAARAQLLRRATRRVLPECAAWTSIPAAWRWAGSSTSAPRPCAASLSASATTPTAT